MLIYPRRCNLCKALYKHRSSFSQHISRGACERTAARNTAVSQHEQKFISAKNTERNVNVITYRKDIETSIIPHILEEEEEEERIKEADEVEEVESEEEEESPPSYETTLIQQQFIDGTLNLPLTVHGTIDNPLFNANELGQILELSNIRMSLKNIDEEDKVVNSTYTLGGTQQAVFLTEEGMYQVVMLSRKPVAKKLRKFAAGLLKQKRMELQNATQQKAVMFEKALKIEQKEVQRLKKTHEINARKKERSDMRNELRNAPTESIYLYTDNRGFHKIGKTKEDVKKRTDAQRTSLPELNLRGEYKCISCGEIEDVLHLILHEHRVDKNREFFDIDIEKADTIIRNVILFIDGYRRLNKDEKSKEIITFTDEMKLSIMLKMCN